MKKPPNKVQSPDASRSTTDKHKDLGSEAPQSLLEFPCDFPIKIIGNNHDSFLAEMLTIIRKHFPETLETDLQCNPSQQNTYLAIRVIVCATDRETLDALYYELSKHPDTKMVL